MKRIIFLFKLNVIIVFCAAGQNVKDSIKQIELNRLVIGAESSMTYAEFVDPATNNEYFDFHYRIEPEISFYLNSNIGLGIKGIYANGKSNYRSFNTLYGLGAFVRYYYPLYLKKEKLKGFNNRFLAFVEFGYNKTNFFVNSLNENPINTSPFTVHLYRIPIGFSIRIWKEFYTKIALLPEFYRPGGNLLRYELGFEYHFKR